jgi:hypothetical protein
MFMQNTYSRWLVLCVCMVTGAAARSQDRIYMERDTKEGRVVNITADHIKYQNAKRNGALTTVARDKVLVVFNQAGHFLVVPTLTDSLEQSQRMVKDFVKGTASPEPTDKLITLQQEVINCHIESEAKRTVQFVTTQGPKQISKSQLAAIIYKDGHHKIMTGIKKAIDPLAAVQKRILDRYTPAQPEVSKEDVATVPVVATDTVTVPATNASSSIRPVPVQTGPDMAQAPVTEVAASTNTGGVAATTDKPGKQYIEALGEVKFEEYERKALAKTNDLKVYIQQLCDKQLEWVDADKFIDMAVGLFTGEEARVETSSVNSSNVSRFRIREYLRRIKLIQYDKVEIEWTHVQYVSKLRKGPDGNYYGVISFEQTFKGYSGDNQLQYSDVTRKNIEVILKTYNRYVDGKSVPTWDVFLSEIKVISTKA